MKLKSSLLYVNFVYVLRSHSTFLPCQALIDVRRSESRNYLIDTVDGVLFRIFLHLSYVLDFIIQRPKWRRKSGARLIALVLAVLTIGSGSTAFFSIINSNDGQKYSDVPCQVHSESLVVKSLLFARIGTDSIIPFAIILIANIILIKSVLKSQEDLNSMGESMANTSSTICSASTSTPEKTTAKMINDTQDQSMPNRMPHDNIDKSTSTLADDTKNQAVASNPDKSTSNAARDTMNMTIASPSDKIISGLDNDRKILANADRKIPKAMKDFIAKRKAQRQLAIMLICTSVAFICLTLPFPIMRPISIWYDYRKSPTTLHNFTIAQQCTSLLLAANASINVFVYLVSGTKFRQDFKTLFVDIFQRCFR